MDGGYEEALNVMTGVELASLCSLLNFTLPNHQINQDGDETDGDQGEDHHQPLRCILQVILFSGAVLEEEGVDVQEEVLNVGVGIVAADHVGQLLQAQRHVVVRSA